MQINSCICPNCGANINITNIANNDVSECEYCGATFPNSYIQSQLKNEQTITHLEYELKKMKLGIGILVGGFLAFFSGYGFYYLILVYMLYKMFDSTITLPKFNNNNNTYEITIAKVPSSIEGYNQKDYVAIETILREAGFTDIRCVPLNNLAIGIFKKPSTVSSIVIGGKEIITGGEKFPADSSVLITYNSFPSH